MSRRKKFKTKGIPFLVRLDEATYEKLRRTAFNKRIDMSDIVRTATEKELKKEK